MNHITKAKETFEELAHAYFEPGGKDYWDAIEFAQSFLEQELLIAHQLGREEMKAACIQAVPENIEKDFGLVDLGRPEHKIPCPKGLYHSLNEDCQCTELELSKLYGTMFESGDFDALVSLVKEIEQLAYERGREEAVMYINKKLRYLPAGITAGDIIKEYAELNKINT